MFAQCGNCSELPSQSLTARHSTVSAALWTEKLKLLNKQCFYRNNVLRYQKLQHVFECCLLALTQPHNQGCQSVVKIGAQTRRGSGRRESHSDVQEQSPWWGSGAKFPEAIGYYRFKFEFWLQLHRCVLKNCILCLCDKFAVSLEKYHLTDKSVF